MWPLVQNPSQSAKQTSSHHNVNWDLKLVSKVKSTCFSLSENYQHKILPQKELTSYQLVTKTREKFLIYAK